MSQYSRTSILSLVNETRIRLDKFLSKYSSVDLVLPQKVNALLSVVEYLLKDNDVLKEQIFQIEQEVPEEQRWHNIIAAKINRVLASNNPPEYFEITSSDPQKTVILSFQKKYGKSPQTIIRELQAVNKKLETKNDNMVKSTLELERKLSILKKECAELKNFQIGSDELMLENQAELERHIERLNKVIQRYNLTMIRKKLATLHKSMVGAFYESWTRAANSESNVMRLNNEIASIKRTANVKAVKFSKFGKYKKDK
jgi:hypothetical protein